MRPEGKTAIATGQGLMPSGGAWLVRGKGKK